ncbi:MAG: hypothetical protein WBW98_09960 [Candidatus Sulfotelmatobacter sp.]|jgi:hypothetical protein
MAEAVRDAQQEFWSPPSVLDPPATAVPPAVASEEMADACGGCGSEFMIAARFCHTCGLRRAVLTAASTEVRSDAEVIAGLWARNVAWVRNGVGWAADTWREIPFPDWLHYLHFHEIKRWVGLPTAALIAFILGLGCVAGAIGVSLFYKASNLAEFQAIQMWRIEWLLAATASFVAGILLKEPSDSDRE